MARSLLLLILCFIYLPSINANTYTDSPEPPNKAAATFLKPLLLAVNSGKQQKISAFIAENFETGFLNAYPMDAHVGFMMNVHQQHNKLKFHSYREYPTPLAPNEIVAIVQSSNTEMWHAVTIYTSEGTPAKISGLSFNDARTPNNLPKTAALTLEQVAAELDAYVQRMVKKDLFSGTVLLAHEDKVLYTTAHGLASKRFNIPNNLQTKFNLGSMNKMFTSIAIMQLVEAGKLSLTDKLSKFADEGWLSKDVSGKIEVQHLLTHSSGLGSYFNQTYMESSKNLYRKLDDYKPLIKDETLQFEPGTDNRYSNTGMFMLGVIIENVSGMDYFSYVDKHIHKIAGMTNTNSYEMDQPVPNLAIGYSRAPDTQTGWRNNIYSHVLKGGPAGGGFSTVEDLHRFALALTQYKLLNQELTEVLYSPKPELKSPRYGYGFGIDDSPQGRRVGHAGGFDGISSDLGIWLKQGYVAAVMSNYSNGARPVEMKIRSLLSRVEE